MRFATSTLRTPLRHEVLGGELAHLARADDQHAAAVERLEDLLGELDGGVADRDRVLADLGLVADALADLEALAEQLVEDALARTRLERVLVGLFDLPEDLGLANDHRVERSDHPEEVPHDRLALEDVEVADQLVTVEIVVVGEEVDDRSGAVHVCRGDRVDLGAVARGDDDGLGDSGRRGEQRQRLFLPVRGEGELLAYLDRGRLVAQADECQMHIASFASPQLPCRSEGHRYALAGAVHVVQASRPGEGDM